MLIESWAKNTKYALHIEPTNVCNAACPICPRYVAGSRLERPDLNPDSISINQYKKWFPADFLANKVSRVMLCGNQGDPVAANDIVEIVEYTLAHISDQTPFILHTNGGLRSEKIWKQLGELIQGNNRTVFFSIDGLEDTNHLYRRNVVWQKLMKNVNTFIAAGGNASWDMLVFKHNEHQIELIKELAQSLGFKKTRIKLPDGFYWNGLLQDRGVYDKEGNLEYTISASDIPEYQNAPRGTKRSDIIPPAFKDLRNITYYSAIDEFVKYEDHTIQCKSMHPSLGAEIMIANDGLVLPCCFIGELWQSSRRDASKQQLINMFNIDYMNLNNSPIEDILQFFDDTIIPTWTKSTYAEGKTIACSKICGQNSQITRLIHHTKMQE